MKFSRSGWTFAQTPIWAICDRRLSTGAYRLFSYLAWRQGNDAYCWPSINTIQRDLGASRNTIRRQLRELEDLGYLQTTHRSGRSNHYALIADPNLDPPAHNRQASDEYTPLKNEGGHPSQKRGGSPLKNEGGPPSKMSWGGAKNEPHDDKIERQIQDSEKPDDDISSLWPAIKGTIMSTMAAETYNAHFATAIPGPLQDGTLTIQLPSARSHAATGRLHLRLARAIAAQHHITPRFVAPP